MFKKLKNLDITMCTSCTVLEENTLGDSYCNKHFFNLSVSKWKVKDLVGWISSLFGDKTALYFSKRFMDQNISTLKHFIFKSDHKLVSIMLDAENHFKNIHFKNENKAQYLLEIHYLRYCWRGSDSFNIKFRYIFEKTILYDSTLTRRLCDFTKEKRDKLLQKLESIRNISNDLISNIQMFLTSKPLKVRLNELFLKKLKFSREAEISVKILLIEQEGERKEKISNGSFKRILSPILYLIPKVSFKFGIIHTGILFDNDMYFEWDKDSLLFPKNLKASSPVIGIKLKSIFIKRNNYKKVSTNIARCMSYWNCNKMYQFANCNCQDFVIDFCRRMGLEFEIKDGTFKKYLNKIRTTGSLEMGFTFSNEFKRKFNLPFEPKVLIDDHEQLDILVIRLRESNKLNWELIKKTEEYRLLASFDEIFWMKFLSFNVSQLVSEEGRMKYKKYQCLRCRRDENIMKCPFLDESSIPKEIRKRIMEKNSKMNDIHEIRRGYVRIQNSYHDNDMKDEDDDVSQIYLLSGIFGGHYLLDKNVFLNIDVSGV